MREDDGLIYDAGRLRECPSNVAKIGFWKTLFCFHGYRREAKELSGALYDIGEALAIVVSALIMVVLFPVSPIIRAFIKWRQALKQVRQK